MDKIKDIILSIEELKDRWEYKQAIKMLEKYIAIYNNDYRLYEELADIYLYMWDLKRWLKSIVYALNLNNKSATWNYLKWFILLSQDKVKEAISYLEKSNKLMWNNSEVLRNLWWAYTMDWQAERWITILKRALALSPNDNLITEDLAMALIWIWEIKEWNKLLEWIWKKLTI